jgi:hypothetical protein
MNTPPAIIFVWRDGVMEPLDRFSRLADSSFTSGHAYRMIVQEEETRRSGEQNKKFWAMLTEISQQKEHCGRHYSPDQWKVLFMHAWGQEVQFLPSLDNSTFVPFPYRSSKLSKEDMIELIEWIGAWSAQNGVIFRNDPVAA